MRHGLAFVSVSFAVSCACTGVTSTDADAGERATVTCGEGTHLVGTQCLVTEAPDGGLVCGVGTHLELGTECRPDVAPDAGATITCGPGTHLENDSECRPDVAPDAGNPITCGPGTHLSGAQCVANAVADAGTMLTCGAGTHLVGTMCVPDAVTSPPTTWTLLRSTPSFPGASMLSASGRYVASVPVRAPTDGGAYALGSLQVHDVQTSTRIDVAPATLVCLISDCWSSTTPVAFAPNETTLLATYVPEESSSAHSLYYVVDMATGVTRTLDATTLKYTFLGWAPNSTALLFFKSTSTNFLMPTGDVVSVSLATLAETKLLSVAASGANIAFSTSGTTLVLSTTMLVSTVRTNQVLTMPVAGGAPTVLVGQGVLAGDVLVTSSDVVVYRADATPGMAHLYAKPLTGGAVVDLGLSSRFSLSPNTLTALVGTATQWRTIPVAGGTAAPVGITNPSSCAWADDTHVARVDTTAKLAIAQTAALTSTPLASNVSGFTAKAGRVFWHVRTGTLTLPGLGAMQLRLGDLMEWTGTATTRLWGDVVDEGVPANASYRLASTAVLDAAGSRLTLNVNYLDAVRGFTPGPNNGQWLVPLP